MVLPDTKSVGIESLCAHKINKDIFENLQMYTSNEDLLITSLCQNPFGQSVNLEEIRSLRGDKIYNKILLLNRLHRLNDFIFNSEKSNELDEIVVFFLVTLKIVLKNIEEFPEGKKCLTPKKARFAMKLLQSCGVYQLMSELEDSFFELAYPNEFERYHTFLKLTEKIHREKEQQVRTEFKKLLTKINLSAKIYTRVKSIYSIYNKMLDKNVLYSQILDNIGIRLIVKKIEDCYAAVDQILKEWPIIQNKIKDYIAVPKENGYQSIHLTILYQNFPVEIQVRTEEMDHCARYGSAAHRQYKHINVD